MIQITKIKLENLLAFVNSKQYTSFSNKPISILRVNSYINNPNANKDDIVLYMAFSKGKLVGYRTILSDVFYNQNQSTNFGWLSGNWVDSKYRRKNISTTLFNEVLSDWNNKLMFSNYAEASKALYDKTSVFKELKTINGIRYYRRFCLSDILPVKHAFFNTIKPILKINDFLLNLFFDFRFTKNNSQIDVIKLTDWNHETYQFLSKFKENELFKRDSKTYQWIQNFPWIKTDLTTKKQAQQYHFSSFATVFINNFYTIKNEGQVVAIINISIKNQQLKVPYFYSFSEGIKPAKNLISTLCKEHQINILTIYNNELNTLFNKTYFIKRKSFTQKYFITDYLMSNYKNLKAKNIQTGDGDSVFT